MRPLLVKFSEIKWIANFKMQFSGFSFYNDGVLWSELRESKWHAAETTVNNQQQQWTLPLKQYSCVLFEVPMNFEVLENCQYYPNKVCILPSVLLGGAIVIIFCFSGCQTPICFKVFWSTTWKIRSVTQFTAVLKINHLGQAEVPRANKNYFWGIPFTPLIRY